VTEGFYCSDIPAFEPGKDAQTNFTLSVWSNYIAIDARIV